MRKMVAVTVVVALLGTAVLASWATFVSSPSPQPVAAPATIVDPHTMMIDYRDLPIREPIQTV